MGVLSRRIYYRLRISITVVIHFLDLFAHLILFDHLILAQRVGKPNPYGNWLNFQMSTGPSQAPKILLRLAAHLLERKGEN